MHNIPKAFELEQGGDTRCFIMDNHRPFHLANVHSRHNVVVFDDLQEMEEDQHNQVIPSDGSDLSGDSDGDDTSEEDDDEAEVCFFCYRVVLFYVTNDGFIYFLLSGR